MADFNLTRSEYLKAMYSDTDKAVSALSPATINQVSTSAGDAQRVSDIAAETSYAITEATQEAQSAADSATESADIPWWQQLGNTITTAVNGIWNGILSAVDAVGDAVITAAGAVGSLFGADTQWAEDAISYDWESQAVRALNTVNPFAYMTSTFNEDPNTYFDDWSIENTQSMINSTTNNSWGGQTLYSVASGVGAAVPTVGLAFATGGTSLGAQLGMQAGLGFVQGFGTGTEKALTNGADNLGSAAAYGALSGGVNAALNAAETVIGGLASAATGGATGKWISNAADTLATNVFHTTSETSKAVIKGVLTAVANGVEEGAEEAFQSFIDPYLREWTYDRGAIEYAWGEGYEDWTNEILMSAMIGAAVGTVTSAITQPMRNRVNNAMSDLDQIDQARTQANYLLMQGDIEGAQAQYETAYNLARDYNEKYGSYFRRVAETNVEGAMSRRSRSDPSYDFVRSVEAWGLDFDTDGSIILSENAGNTRLSVNANGGINVDGYYPGNGLFYNGLGKSDAEIGYDLQAIRDRSGLEWTGDITESGRLQMTIFDTSSDPQLEVDTDTGRIYNAESGGEVAVVYSSPAPEADTSTTADTAAATPTATGSGDRITADIEVRPSSAGEARSIGATLVEQGAEVVFLPREVAQSTYAYELYRATGLDYLGVSDGGNIVLASDADSEITRPLSRNEFRNAIREAYARAGYLGEEAGDVGADFGGPTDTSPITPDTDIPISPDSGADISTPIETVDMSGVSPDIQQSKQTIDAALARYRSRIITSADLPEIKTEVVPAWNENLTNITKAFNRELRITSLNYGDWSEDGVRLHELSQSLSIENVSFDEARVIYSVLADLGGESQSAVLIQQTYSSIEENMDLNTLTAKYQEAVNAGGTISGVELNFPLSSIEGPEDNVLAKVLNDLDIGGSTIKVDERILSISMELEGEDRDSAIASFNKIVDTYRAVIAKLTEEGKYDDTRGAVVNLARVEFVGRGGRENEYARILEQSGSDGDGGHYTESQREIIAKAREANQRAIAEERAQASASATDGAVGETEGTGQGQLAESDVNAQSPPAETTRSRASSSDESLSLVSDKTTKAKSSTETSSSLTKANLEKLGHTLSQRSASNADKVIVATNLYQDATDEDFSYFDNPTREGQRAITETQEIIQSADVLIYDSARARRERAITYSNLIKAVKSVLNEYGDLFGVSDLRAATRKLNYKQIHDIFVDYNITGDLSKTEDLADDILDIIRRDIRSRKDLPKEAIDDFVKELDSVNKDLVLDIQNALEKRAVEAEYKRYERQIQRLKDRIKEVRKEGIEKKNEAVKRQQLEDYLKRLDALDRDRERLAKHDREWSEKYEKQRERLTAWAHEWRDDATNRSRLAKASQALRNTIERQGKPQSAGGNAHVVVPDIFREISKAINVSNRKGGLTDNAVEKLVALGAEYTKQLMTVYKDFAFSEDLKQAFNELTELKDTKDGLEKVYRESVVVDIARMINHQLKDSQRAYVRKQKRAVAQSYEVVKSLAEISKDRKMSRLTGFLSKAEGPEPFLRAILTPESPAYKILITEQEEALGNFYREIATIGDRFGDSYAKDKFGLDKETIQSNRRKIIRYNGVELSLDQAMDVYLNAKADANRHIMETSGISYTDPRTRKRVNVDKFPVDIEEFGKLLPDKVREYVDYVYDKFFNEYAQDKIAAIYERRNGIEMETVPGGYVPIHRADLTQRITDSDQSNKNLSSYGRSSIVRTRTNTNQPLDVSAGFYSLFEDYSADFANYIYRSEAKDHLNTLLSTRFGNRGTFSGEMGRLIGDRNWNSLLTLMEQQLMYKSSGDKREGWLGRLFSNAQVAVLGLNPSVMLKQFLSAPYISRVTSLKSLLQGLILGARTLPSYTKEANFIRTHSGDLAHRWEDGGYAAANILTSRFKKLQRWFTSPSNFTDQFVIVAIAWPSAQYEAKARGYGDLGTMANRMAAIDILEDIVKKTQSNSAALYTSKFRSDRTSFISKVFFTFQADSQHKVEMLAEDTWGARQASIRREGYDSQRQRIDDRIKEAKDELHDLNDKPESEKTAQDREREEELKDRVHNYEKTKETIDRMEEWDRTYYSGRNTANRFAMFVANTIFAAVISVLIGNATSWLKGKDRDEDSLQDDILSFFEEAFISYLPFVGTVVGALMNNQSSVSAIQLEGIEQAVSFISEFITAAQNGNLSTKQNALIYDALTALGYTIGMPFKNMLDYFAGLAKRLGGTGGQHLYDLIHGYSSTTMSSNINSAIEQGNLTSAARQIQSAMAIWKTGDISWTLAKELAETGVLPRDSLTDDLTSTQAQQFRETYTQADAVAESMIANNQYKNLTVEQRAKALTALYSAYYELAQSEIDEDYEGSTRLTRLVVASDGSLQLARIIPALQQISALEATRTQTRKTLATQFLNRLTGFTKAEKYLILYLSGFGLEESAQNVVLQYLVRMGCSRAWARSFLGISDE